MKPAGDLGPPVMQEGNVYFRRIQGFNDIQWNSLECTGGILRLKDCILKFRTIL